MNYTTIVDAKTAAQHVHDDDWLFLDCRFDLADSSAGRAAYFESHIRGAQYVDLDEQLTGDIKPGVTGRHPLPDPTEFEETMRRLGLNRNSQVVVYDQTAGFMCAARLWWLLKWAGHDAVAVLDGGFSVWEKLGHPTSYGQPRKRPVGNFSANYQKGLLADAETVTEISCKKGGILVDSRAADRYRGENETIDPIAGHIPGALSHPFAVNIGRDGKLFAATQLRQVFEHLKSSPAEQVVFYCGSGVTAAHNILAYTIAYSKMPHLYAGSWSEWITDQTRPVAIGPNP